MFKRFFRTAVTTICVFALFLSGCHIQTSQSSEEEFMSSSQYSTDPIRTEDSSSEPANSKSEEDADLFNAVEEGNVPKKYVDDFSDVTKGANVVSGLIDALDAYYGLMRADVIGEESEVPALIRLSSSVAERRSLLVKYWSAKRKAWGADAFTAVEIPYRIREIRVPYRNTWIVDLTDEVVIDYRADRVDTCSVAYVRTLILENENGIFHIILDLPNTDADMLSFIEGCSDLPEPEQKEASGLLLSTAGESLKKDFLNNNKSGTSINISSLHRFLLEWSKPAQSTYQLTELKVVSPYLYQAQVATIGMIEDSVVVFVRRLLTIRETDSVFECIDDAPWQIYPLE